MNLNPPILPHCSPNITTNSTLNPLAQPFYPLSQPTAGSQPIMCINARSIKNKTAELAHICSTVKPLIVCITETWLSPQSSFTVLDMTVFDRPPDENRSATDAIHAYGGVCIMVRSGMFPKVTHRSDLSIPLLEATWVEIALSSANIHFPEAPHVKKLVIGAVYRPPALTPSSINTFCNSLQHCLNTLKNRTTSILLMGDFNAKSCHWHGTTTDAAGRHSLFGMFSLTQLVNFPTHESLSGMGAALDLVVTNIPDSMSCLRATAPLGQSDHSIVVGHIRTVPCPEMPTYRSRDARSTPLDVPDFSVFSLDSLDSNTVASMNTAMSHIHCPAALSLERRDPDISVDNFYSIFHNICARFLPRQKPPAVKRIHMTPPPWLTSTLRHQIKKKRDSYSVYRKVPSADNFAIYRREQNVTRNMSRTAHRLYISSLSASTARPASPSLFQFVRKLRSPQGNSRTTVTLNRWYSIF